MEQSESQLRLRCLCPGMAAGLLPRAARGSRLHRPVNVVVVIQALVVVGVLVAVMGVLVVATGSVGVLVAVAGPGGGDGGGDGRTAPASMCSADLHSHPVL